jgi:hypothetical protein
MLRVGVGSSVQLSVYDVKLFFKSKQIKHSIMEKFPNIFKNNIFTHTVSAFIAGIFLVFF